MTPPTFPVDHGAPARIVTRAIECACGWRYETASDSYTKAENRLEWRWREHAERYHGTRF